MQITTKEIISLFIHLGGVPPKHLILNIERFLDLFPQRRVVLLLSEGTEVSNGTKFETAFVNESSFPSLEEMGKVHDFSFRNGFWKNTFLRLFAIEHFQKLNPNSGVLHIESDVILMPSFPWDFFKDSTKLNWLRVHDGADVAAILYSPNEFLISKLTRDLLSTAFAEPNTTDMSALFKFAVSHPGDHAYLPSLTSLSSQSENLEEFHAKVDSLLKGYFDPLAIGIWLFGQDPKNSYGVTRRYVHQTHHDLDPRSLELRMDQNGDVLDKQGLRIFSFHIHSKNVSLFGKNWKNEMASQLMEANLLEKEKSFNLVKFKEAMADRSLISHILINLNRQRFLRSLKKYRHVNSLTLMLKQFLKIR